jgi:broad specificity phosphatase PhoE
MLQLYIARHGDTEWSLNGRHTSRTDLPLLPSGEEQARDLGRQLSGVDFVAAYSSDLHRAEQTAWRAGFENPVVTPLLREFDYGDYEGITSAEIHQRRPGWQLFRDGCPGGETPEQVYGRAQAFIKLLDGLEGAVIAFSHGHFSRALGTAWADLGIDAAVKLAFDTGAFSVLEEDENGRLIKHWNLPPEKA